MGEILGISVFVHANGRVKRLTDEIDMAAGPTRLAAENRRQAIVDIARGVFLDEGYADASMSEIAARVGGSKGTLYNYFGSKEALFVAFLRQECAVEAEIAYAFDHPEDDMKKVLKYVGCKNVEFLLSDKVLSVHRLVIAESQRFPELGRTFYEEGPRTGIIKLADLFKRWMGEGRLHKSDPMHAAEQFSDLCKSGLYQRRLWNVVQYNNSEMEANVDRAVAIFLTYYLVQTG